MSSLIDCIHVSYSWSHFFSSSILQVEASSYPTRNPTIMRYSSQWWGSGLWNYCFTLWRPYSFGIYNKVIRYNGANHRILLHCTWCTCVTMWPEGGSRDQYLISIVWLMCIVKKTSCDISLFQKIIIHSTETSKAVIISEIILLLHPFQLL